MKPTVCVFVRVWVGVPHCTKLAIEQELFLYTASAFACINSTVSVMCSTVSQCLHYSVAMRA